MKNLNKGTFQIQMKNDNFVAFRVDCLEQISKQISYSLKFRSPVSEGRDFADIRNEIKSF